MYKAISMFAMGLVLGGLFMNAKFVDEPVVKASSEVIYGTRIGPSGELILITHR